MIVDGKYKVGALVGTGKVATFEAEVLPGTQKVFVHLFASGTSEPELAALFAKARELKDRLPPGEGRILELGIHAGSSYVVTEAAPDCTSLEPWLDAELERLPQVTGEVAPSEAAAAESEPSEFTMLFMGPDSARERGAAAGLGATSPLNPTPGAPGGRDAGLAAPFSGTSGMEEARSGDRGEVPAPRNADAGGAPVPTEIRSDGDGFTKLFQGEASSNPQESAPEVSPPPGTPGSQPPPYASMPPPGTRNRSDLTAFRKVSTKRGGARAQERRPARVGPEEPVARGGSASEADEQTKLFGDPAGRGERVAPHPASRGPEPLIGPQPAGSDRPPPGEPGEFTRLFRSESPAPQEPVSGTTGEPRPPVGSGEFTKVFQRSGGTPPQPAAPPEAAPFSEPPPEPPQPSPPPAANSAKETGDVSQLFGGSPPSEPVAPPAPAQAPPRPPEAEGQPGEFTKLMGRPGQSGPGPASPGGQEPGAFTRMFKGANSPPVESKAGPVSPAGAEKPGEYTRLFGSPPPEGGQPLEGASTPGPAEEQAGEFTKLFKGSQRPPTPQASPRGVAAGPSAGGRSGGDFTKLFGKSGGPGQPAPGTPPSPVWQAEGGSSGATGMFDPGAAPSGSGVGAPESGESEYTRIVKGGGAAAPPPAATSSQAPAAPGVQVSAPAPTASTGSAAEAAEEPSREEVRKRSSLLILALAACGLLLIALVVVLFVVVSGPDEESEPAAEQQMESTAATSGGVSGAAGGSVQGPRVQQPSVQGPQVRGPSVSGTSVQAPSVQGPRGTAPRVQAPQARVPSARVPSSTARVPSSTPAGAESTSATSSSQLPYIAVIIVLSLTLLVAVGAAIFFALKK